MKLMLMAAALLMCSAAFGQQGSSVIQGAFTASVGPAVYRGKWSARVSTRTPNVAAGSWILMNDQGDTLLQGTWSAQKSPAGWKGTWRARVLRGRAYSGTWTSSQPGPDSKTFADMLQTASKGETTGTWRSGGYGGNWRLTPTP